MSSSLRSESSQSVSVTSERVPSVESGTLSGSVRSLELSTDAKLVLLEFLPDALRLEKLRRSDPVGKRRSVRLCDDVNLEGSVSGGRRNAGVQRDDSDDRELPERLRSRWCCTVSSDPVLLIEEKDRPNPWSELGSLNGLLVDNDNIMAPERAWSHMSEMGGRQAGQQKGVVIRVCTYWHGEAPQLDVARETTQRKEGMRNIISSN